MKINRFTAASAACGALGLALVVAGPSSGAPTSFDEKLKLAVAEMSDGKCDGPAWQAIAADRAFGAQASAIKSVTYFSLAICLGGPRVREWLQAATAEPDALPIAWTARAEDELTRDDINGALQSLEAATRASARTNSTLQIENEEVVSYLHRKLRGDGQRTRRLLSALDQGGWAPSDPLQDASYLWSEYAALLLADDRQWDAGRVARKVTSPRQLVLMTLDKRFDAIVAADPRRFDVVSAAEEELQRQQKLYASATNDIGAYGIIDNLRLFGRFDQALSFADLTLKKPKILDNHGHDYRNWIEDRRAYVLYEMGRGDDAVAGERQGASRTEHGETNVSQSINLAGLLNGVGRHADALDVLSGLKSARVSPYGAMWIAAERFCAARALERTAEGDDALAFTAAHTADNRGARAKALLCADDLDGSARLFVDWLHDPLERGKALLQLSTFKHGALPAFDAAILQRLAAVRGMASVHLAIAEVGRTADLPLYGAVWTDFD